MSVFVLVLLIAMVLVAIARARSRVDARVAGTLSVSKEPGQCRASAAARKARATLSRPCAVRSRRQRTAFAVRRTHLRGTRGPCPC